MQIPYTQEDYQAAKARDPEFYRSADSLEYGKPPAIPEENVDKMVAELEAGCVMSHLIYRHVFCFGSVLQAESLCSACMQAMEGCSDCCL